MDRSPHRLARNVTRLSHLDLPGAGQVTVAGDYACIHPGAAAHSIGEAEAH